jgi:hypothetical protein
MANRITSISAQPTVQIRIDRGQFRVEARPLTGRELRQLPNPPVDPDRDVFLMAGAGQNDRLIADDDTLDLSEGMSFITVPKTILAGVRWLDTSHRGPTERAPKLLAADDFDPQSDP